MKWIKELNVQPEKIKLLEENIGKKLLGNGFGGDILDMTPQVQATKAKIKQVDYSKQKSAVQQRNNQQNAKASYGLGENIYKPYTNKGLILKNTRNSYDSIAIKQIKRFE